MKKEIGARNMDSDKVCCDQVEEKLWVMVEDNVFGEVIELLVGQGVSHSDMGEKLFAYANQAVGEQRFDTARSILVFLISSLEDKIEAPPLLTLIGDLYVTENRYDEARKYYAQLPLNFKNIKKIFGTFISLKDVDGLLSVRNNILSRLKEPDHVNELHRLVHGIFVEIASDPDIKGSAREQYLTNQGYLQKIDSAIVRKISGYASFYSVENSAPDALKCLKVSGRIYVRNGRVWERVTLRSSTDRLKRKALKQDINIAIRCDSIGHLIEFRDALATDKSEFYKFQCYLIVSLDLLENFMVVEDLISLTDCDFIIRVIDERNLERDLREVLLGDKGLLPSFLIHFKEEDNIFSKECLAPFLNNCKQKIFLKIAGYEKQLAKLYPIDFSKSIQSKIKNKKLRILFQTSSYTTFLQYASRDIADGFKKLGFEVFIEIENEGEAVGIRSDICMKNMIDFRPDLIFNINHLRFEYPWIPKTIPYVTWVQDEMRPLFSQKGAERISELDFIYYAHSNWKKLLIEYGYRKDNMGELALSVNDTVFHPIRLAEKDIDEYGCDVSYVANCSTTAFQELQKIIKANPSELHHLIQKVYNVVCEIFSTGESLYGFHDYVKIVENLSKENHIILTDKVKMRIATTFWQVIGSRIFRQQPLEWLSEAGYDIAIYGNGWEHHPKLAKHSRGWIDNGIDLCKVFNASRINLSVHQTGNYSSRFFDGFVSGGFFLMRYHPADFESFGLCKLIDMEYDQLTFRSKEDLLDKADLYLSTPELKEAFVYPVRQQILQKYTYPKRIRNILGDVSDRLSNLAMGN